MADTPAASALDQFAQTTRLALKMQCVQEQLDSVLVSTHPLLLCTHRHMIDKCTLATPPLVETFPRTHIKGLLPLGTSLIQVPLVLSSLH